jgi:hypothetical protein
MWAECSDDYYFGRDGEMADYEMAMSFYKKPQRRNIPAPVILTGA